MEVFECSPDVPDVPDYSGSCDDKMKPGKLNSCRHVLAAWAMGAEVWWETDTHPHTSSHATVSTRTPTITQTNTQTPRRFTVCRPESLIEREGLGMKLDSGPVLESIIRDKQKLLRDDVWAGNIDPTRGTSLLRAWTQSACGRHSHMQILKYLLAWTLAYTWMNPDTHVHSRGCNAQKDLSWPHSFCRPESWSTKHQVHRDKI